MQRYHSASGSGDGIDHKITSADIGKPAMYRSKKGFGDWVRYDEVLDAIKSARLAGIADGRAEGQTKLEAYQSIDQTPELDGVTLQHTGSGDVGVYNLRDTDFVGYRGSLGLLRVSTLKAHEEKAAATVDDSDDTFGRMQRFIADQAERIAARDQTDKLTKQLLNELYHDRARLENIVTEAAALISLGHDLLVARQQGEDPSIVGDEDYILGQLAQFIAANGDAE